MDLSSAPIFVCFLILFVAGVAKIGRSIPESTKEVVMFRNFVRLQHCKKLPS